MTTNEGSAPSPGAVRESPLSTDERAELQRLRAARGGGRARHRPGVARWTAVVVLLILTGVLAVGAVTARFARSQVFDTARYVSTVAPLADDPTVRNALADRITQTITAKIDIRGLTEEALNTLTENTGQVSDRPRIAAGLNALPALVAAQAESYIHQIALTVVSGDEFAEAWSGANRRAHQALVRVVDGQTQPGVEVADDGTISISLKPILATVRERLDARGFTAANRIPDIDTQVVLFHATELPKYQKWLRALNRSANVLPWLTLATAVAAIRLAPRGRRLRALTLVGVTGAVAMTVLAIGVLVARGVYMDSLPPEVLSRPAATVLFDTMINPLRVSLRAVAVTSIVAALVGYLAGSSQSARSVRSGFGRFVTVARGRRGGPPNAVETFAAHYRIPLCMAVLAGAVLALVFWSYPTGLVVVGIAVVAGVLLLAIQIAARPAPDVDRVEPTGANPTART